MEITYAELLVLRRRDRIVPKFTYLTENGIYIGVTKSSIKPYTGISSGSSVDPLPSQTGHAGKFLTTDGTNASWSAAPADQDLFNKIIVSGELDIDANSPTTSLTFEAGPGMTITTDPATFKVTFTSSASGIADADYGDVTVSGGGTVWTVDNVAWANVSGAPAFLTSETDPIFLASDAAAITSADISDWNTAHSWGNHATAGYLTSFTETDPVFTAHVASSISLTNVNNWNSAFGWGDHNAMGYLTSETDPIFSMSDAATITAPDISNWNTAFGWGDHSLAGYLTGTLTVNRVPYVDASGDLIDSSTLWFQSSTNRLFVGSTLLRGGIIVEGPTSVDTNYTVFEGSRRWPVIKLRDTDTGTPGSTFDIWNIINQLRFGTNAGNSTTSSLLIFSGNSGTVLTQGKLGIGHAASSDITTAWADIAASTSSVPHLRLRPGVATTSSLNAGNLWTVTDKIYYHITTGAGGASATKEITLNDTALTSGRVPIITTNGRLTDSSTLTFASSTLTTPTLAVNTSTGIGISVANLAQTFKMSFQSTGADTRIFGLDSSQFFLYNNTLAQYAWVSKDNGNFGIGNSTNVDSKLVVYGNSSFGGNNTATSYVDIVECDPSIAQLRLRPGVAPSSPNDGEMWYDAAAGRPSFETSSATEDFAFLSDIPAIIGDMISTNNLSDVANMTTAKTNLGINNVDNTSDLNKPVSTATQAALNNKQDILIAGVLAPSTVNSGVASGNWYGDPNSNVLAEPDGWIDINLGGTDYKIPIYLA